MTKTEMVNRLIILGCIKESQREFLIRYDGVKLLKLYIHLVGNKMSK